jgi:hypothetical protein
MAALKITGHARSDLDEGRGDRAPRELEIFRHVALHGLSHRNRGRRRRDVFIFFLAAGKLAQRDRCQERHDFLHCACSLRPPGY